ncbi:DDHD domain-containing protein [Limtongia smithiae]|uniref:DDHD domain-containing protein n=1 Tax=Limtongia smithiae TaxID=1125753 RepID=UPI0034CE819C
MSGTSRVAAEAVVKAHKSSSSSSRVDHTVPFRQKLSLHNLPPDTPPLNVRWYFATDVPRTKPFVDRNWKPPKPPSKFSPFTANDSRNIEMVYQRDPKDPLSMSLPLSLSAEEDTVAVNEDLLFKVDIRKRELAPLYWKGPTYDVRRGTWFYADSSTLKPCDENLANQIEEGFLKIQPFRKQSPSTATIAAAATPEIRVPNSTKKTESASEYLSVSQNTLSSSRSRAASFTESITSAFSFRSISPSPSRQFLAPDGPGSSSGGGGGGVSSRSNSQDRRAGSEEKSSSLITQNGNTWPLYGPHMGKYVVYSNDAKTAWIISDDFYGKFTSTVYQRLTAGASMGGLKIVRGWSNEKSRPKKDTTTTSNGTSAVHSDSEDDIGLLTKTAHEDPVQAAADLVEAIQRSTSMSHKPADKATDEINNEYGPDENSKDYRPEEDEDQHRDIDHLVLCVHGIGQKLGQRMESVNFVSDISTFRKTIKSVYAASPDLQTLNDEVGQEKQRMNSRVQVLPVCWRNNIKFGMAAADDDYGSKRSTREQDIGDIENEIPIEDGNATLEDITIDGVPALRGVISEVLLDILLYYQPNYRERIIENVVRECNSIYKTFRKWNPEFDGKVSLVGHSLGAAIAFDILCQQPRRLPPTEPPSRSASASAKQAVLEFDVDSYFGLGSPVGLFQMLKGKRVAPRLVSSANSSASGEYGYEMDELSDDTATRPRVVDLYNVFHPADPISYRLEPLVVKRMAELKPQPIPPMRRGLNNQIANLAELTSRVAQSASNMWTSVASGLASSILNKSLGYDTASDASGNASAAGTVQSAATMDGKSDGVGSTSADTASEATMFQRELATTIHNTPTSAGSGSNSNSLSLAVNSNTVETLYSRFQQDSPKLQKAADEHWRLQRDEELIRGLNYTGRVDFALSEGYMDITLLSSLGSHLGYFRDEDVASFVVGQLLAQPYPKKMKCMRVKEFLERGAEGERSRRRGASRVRA